jgi:hypothetical protein
MDTTATTRIADRMNGAAEPSATNGAIIPARQVNGTEVYNSEGEHLGHVYDLMIDKRSGLVAFALMSFGGFLGIGERFHPLPWDVLNYDDASHGFVVDLDKEKLRNAPSFAFDDALDWENSRWRTDIYDHYGARYYWL